jgi:23S rRNA U2552 (ribose-2'-O)-methylase RlmE/FtsJ
MNQVRIVKQAFGHGKKAWFINHINDMYVKKANEHNYRSRASFKLL